MIFEKIREELQESHIWIEGNGYGRPDMNVVILDEAIETINEIESEYNNGWIDIKTKLPKYDEYVLCQGKNSQFIACIDSLDNKWRDNGLCVRINITHWQPLPQPPKGE